MLKNTKTLAKYLFTKGIESSLRIQKILFFLRVEELRSGKRSGFFREKDNFQAWIHGPVNVESFDEMRRFFSGDEEKEWFLLSKKDVAALDATFGEWLKKYEFLSPSALIEKSRSNFAWINARGDLDCDAPCRTHLKEDETFVEFEGGKAI